MEASAHSTACMLEVVIEELEASEESTAPAAKMAEMAMMATLRVEFKM